MPLDQAELDQIRTDAAAGTINPLLSPLAALGLTLRTTQDEATYKESIEGDAIRRRESALYTEFEKAVEEETGIKKNAGEKATDYLKRATGGLKTELQELRDKKDDGTASAADKNRIKELEKLVADKDTEVTEAKTSAEIRLQGYKVDGEANVALKAIEAKLKKDLTGESKQDVMEARLARFKKEFIPEIQKDGDVEKVVYKKANGEYANNTKGIRLTTEEILTQLFDPYLDKAPVQNGAGTKPPKSGDGGNPTKDSYAPSSSVKTHDDLMQDLKANGFLKGTADFSELYKKHKEGLKAR